MLMMLRNQLDKSIIIEYSFALKPYQNYNFPIHPKN
jgi:hypothetical protein